MPQAAGRAAAIGDGPRWELVVERRGAAGAQSAIAAQSLAALGYTDIVELKGGMEEWQAGGRPVLQTQRGGD